MDLTWQISVHPGVNDDAQQLLGYYSDIDPDLAGALVEEVEAGFVFLARYPLGAAKFHGRFRRVALRRFPCLICYRVIASTRTVRVLALVDARRAPASIHDIVTARG